MNRVDRLYALVEELRADPGRPRSASALARRFEVSTRTVERDINALQQAGVPIYAEVGRRGGYVLDRRHTLPPLNLEAHELVALVLVAAALEGTPLHRHARSAIAKRTPERDLAQLDVDVELSRMCPLELSPA